MSWYPLVRSAYPPAPLTPPDRPDAACARPALSLKPGAMPLTPPMAMEPDYGSPLSPAPARFRGHSLVRTPPTPPLPHAMASNANNRPQQPHKRATPMSRMSPANGFPVRYPIHPVPADLPVPPEQQPFMPGPGAITLKRYATSVDERNFLTVYEYKINDQWIIWDYYTGYVHLTGLWKAVGNSKADIVRLVDSSPQLEPVIRRVRGGFLKIQGTWLPFDVARILASRTCYHIRYALVPMFGPQFPDSCLQPHELGFGELQLTTTENARRRRKRPSEAALAAASMAVHLNPNVPSRRRSSVYSQLTGASLTPRTPTTPVAYDPRAFKLPDSPGYNAAYHSSGLSRDTRDYQPSGLGIDLAPQHSQHSQHSQFSQHQLSSQLSSSHTSSPHISSPHTSSPHISAVSFVDAVNRESRPLGVHRHSKSSSNIDVLDASVPPRLQQMDRPHLRMALGRNNWHAIESSSSDEDSDIDDRIIKRPRRTTVEAGRIFRERMSYPPPLPEKLAFAHESDLVKSHDEFLAVLQATRSLQQLSAGPVGRRWSFGDATRQAGGSFECAGKLWKWDGAQTLAEVSKHELPPISGSLKPALDNPERRNIMDINELLSGQRAQ